VVYFFFDAVLAYMRMTREPKRGQHPVMYFAKPLPEMSKPICVI
jgi:hypothetical protein